MNLQFYYVNGEIMFFLQNCPACKVSKVPYVKLFLLFHNHGEQSSFSVHTIKNNSKLELQLCVTMITLSATIVENLPLACRSLVVPLTRFEHFMMSVLCSVEKRVDIENTWRVIMVFKCPQSIFTEIF